MLLPESLRLDDESGKASGRRLSIPGAASPTIPPSIPHIR